MFDRAIELADKYGVACGADPASPLNLHLVAELTERLRQLQFILARVRELERSSEESQRRQQKAMSDQAIPLMGKGVVEAPPEIVRAIQELNAHLASAFLEIRLLTEAFYYFAARAREIVRSLRHLGSFECEGVRDVRNHLIEHPEKRPSKIFAQGFAFGGRDGPVIKGGRPSNEGDKFSDLGLYVNAEEFRVKLEATLTRAIDRVTRARVRDD